MKFTLVPLMNGKKIILYIALAIPWELISMEIPPDDPWRVARETFPKNKLEESILVCPLCSPAILVNCCCWLACSDSCSRVICKGFANDAYQECITNATDTSFRYIVKSTGLLAVIGCGIAYYALNRQQKRADLERRLDNERWNRLLVQQASGPSLRTQKNRLRKTE